MPHRTPKCQAQIYNMGTVCSRSATLKSKKILYLVDGRDTYRSNAYVKLSLCREHFLEFGIYNDDRFAEYNWESLNGEPVPRQPHPEMSNGVRTINTMTWHEAHRYVRR